MTVVFALIGSKVLWLLYIWLGSAIIASWLSDRKGYGEKAGLATGLLLTAAGVLIWLLVPARAGSAWKRRGARNRSAKAADEPADDRPAGS